MICCVVYSTWVLYVILILSFKKWTVTSESTSKLCCLPSVSYINSSSKPEGIPVSRIALGLLGSVFGALRWNSLMLVKRIRLSASPAVCLNLPLLWMMTSIPHPHSPTLPPCWSGIVETFLIHSSKKPTSLLTFVPASWHILLSQLSVLLFPLNLTSEI